MDKVGIKVDVEAPFDQVVADVTEALKGEGFGILTRIDVRDTLKQKLGVDMKRYEILGACNPPFAHRAVTAEPDIGMFLPCNVLVYERDDGKVRVAAVDPMQTIASQAGPAMGELAGEVKARLERVVAKVGERKG